MSIAMRKGVDTKEVPEVDTGVVTTGDMEEGEVEPPTCFNCKEIGHVSRFCTKIPMIYAYYYSPEHVMKDCPDLLKMREEKNTNCNMVHVDPHKNNNKNEEVDIWVVTEGGANTRPNFEHGEGSGQNLDGKIRKAPHPPLKFDVVQEKKYLHKA